MIDTVDQVRALLPEIKRWIPAGIDIRILSDRTETIRASVHDMQSTLAGSIVHGDAGRVPISAANRTDIAAGVTVPLSLAGTCAAMWVVGFSIDNLSLMALAVSVGFVVDDAIVMIENIFRNLEKGHSPAARHASRARARSASRSSRSAYRCLAAFIPLLFMGGIIGRFFREFSVTLAFAIAISTVVSLTVTPMICAHFIREIPSAQQIALRSPGRRRARRPRAGLRSDAVDRAAASRGHADDHGGDGRPDRRPLLQDSQRA